MAQGKVPVGHSAPPKKRKGTGEVSGLITDVLSQYSSSSNDSNKKAKLETEQDAANALAVLRSGSFDEKCSETSSKQEKPSAAPSSDEGKTPNNSPTTTKKSSKDSKVDDFIDIEKAQYTFPERLMELLMNGTVKKAMWWLPGGEAFALVPNSFYDIVLAKYFQGTKFESFTRKLNRWGFKRLSGQGVPKGTIAYYHKLFKKEKPELMKKMRSGKTHPSGAAPDPVFGQVGLDAFVPTALERSISQLPPYLAAHLQRQADPATSALLGQQQHAGLLPSSMNAADAIKLQLLQSVQQQQAGGQPLDAVRQILAQQRAQVLAQLNPAQASPEMTLRRQAELLAMEEIRAAQAQEAAVAQLRARVMQAQNGTAPMPPQTVSSGAQQQSPQPAAAPSSAAADEQIRMLLLRRQLGLPNGGGVGAPQQPW